MAKFWNVLKEDLRALHAKINHEEWVTYRDPNGHAWLPMYSSSGLLMATVVQYQYKTIGGEIADPDIAAGGDFELACLRGTARKHVLRYDQIRGGLITREELSA